MMVVGYEQKSFLGFFLWWNGHLKLVVHPSSTIFTRHSLFLGSLNQAKPLEDDGPVEGDFAPGAIKKNFVPSIHQGSNGEEIIDKVREAMSQVRFWG